jgi:hypothetical protein
MANFCNKDPTFLPPNLTHLIRYDNFIVDNFDTPSPSTPTAYSKSNIRMHMQNYTELPRVINIRKPQHADTYRADGHGNMTNSIQSHEEPLQNVQRIIVPTQSTSLRIIVSAKTLESSRPMNPSLILSGSIPWLIACEISTLIINYINS